MTPSKGRKPRRPPAKSPQQREDQLIAKAVDLAEEQIESGRASAQVITHFLKLGTTREKLEQERMRRENLLLEAKVTALESQTQTEELYREALKAMKRYQGQDDDELADLH